MSYTATLYHNTGFSGNNIPASVSVLASCAKSTETKELQIVQNYPLTSIHIPGTFEDYKDVDYIKIGDYVFQAFPAPMPSNNGAQLDLVFRGITGSGGNFLITQGVTARTTIHSSDTFGAYTQTDPLMTPVQPLEADYKLILSDTAYADVCVSDVDFTQATPVAAVGTEIQGSDLTFPGMTFTDPNDSEKSVTTPYVPGNSTDTTFKISGAALPSNPGTRLFTVEAFNRVKGILRSLGLEGSVSLYKIPLNGTTFTPVETTIGGEPMNYYSAVESTRQSDSTFDPNYADVKNKRVLYGEFNKWGLLTSSGAKSEFNIEDILPENFSGGDVLVFRYNDLRPDGKPYFRFQYYMKSADETSFWIMSVQGAPWQNTPVLWQGASNNWIAQQRFNNRMLEEAAEQQYNLKAAQVSQQRAQIDYAAGSGAALGGDLYREKQVGRGKKAKIVPDVRGTMSAVGSYLIDATTSLADDVVSASRSAEDYERATAYNIAVYGHNRSKELMEFGYSQSAVAPQIDVPYQSNLLREMMGNGVIVYRYKYSDYDVQRIDKLLTMYGYAITRPVQKSDIYPSTHEDGFVYLECQGVGLTSDTLPKWYLDLMEAELEVGVRIWWERPDPSKYEGSTTA